MTRVLERVNISAPGFDGETQFIIKAALQGFLFANVSVPTIYNQEPSHMTHLATTLNFIKVLLTDY
jgi:hypothetical protein